jgi:hypothetical protein
MNPYKLMLLETLAWSVLVISCCVIATACPPSAPVVPSPDADAIAPPAPTPPPTPAPPPAGGDAAPALATDCAAACVAIAAAGCLALADCPRVLCMANADPRFRHYDTACLMRARTPAAVRACGADCSPP